MARRPSPLPAELGEVFTYAEALAAGVSRQRLRAADLTRIFNGVYQRRHPDGHPRHFTFDDDGNGDGNDNGNGAGNGSKVSPPRHAPSAMLGYEQHPAEQARRQLRERALQFARIMPAHMFFIGRTAAVLHQLPVPMPAQGRPPSRAQDRRQHRSQDRRQHRTPNRSQDCSQDRPQDQPNRATAAANAPASANYPIPQLEVGCFQPDWPLRRKQVRSHRLAAGTAELTRYDGPHGVVQVLSPASTWAHLTRVLEHDDAVAMGDAILHEPRVPGHARPQRPGLATREELAAAAMMLPSRQARRIATELTRELTTRAASPPESHLRLTLARWRLPPFTLDVDIRTPGGTLLGSTEIAFVEYRVALEYEGDHHRTNRSQWNRDIDKQNAYLQAGWIFVRVTAELLYRRPHELRERITHALVQQGWVQQQRYSP